jgi:hypothetical protein
MDLAILKAEIDNGLYKRPIEAIAREIRYEPLPDEIRAVIIASWRRGGCSRRQQSNRWCRPPRA